MMITSEVIIFSSSLFGFGRRHKYPQVGMWNVVCTTFVLLLIYRAAAPVVPKVVTATDGQTRPSVRHV
jgi:hypothetical protein